ncbi:MAG: phage tail tube protein [Micromonosporaceae bacterium]
MALRSLLAKEWRLDVNTGTVALPTWTQVKGMSQFKETIDDSTEEDDDFEGEGWGSDVITQRKWKLECEGRRKRDDTTPTFTPDAGQQKILDLGNIVGFEATAQIRYYRRDGSPDAWEGNASVSYKGGGGGVKDLEPFNFDILGQGKRTAIANPAA